MRRRAFVAIVVLAIVAGLGAVYVYPILNPVHVDAAPVIRGNLYLTIKAPGQVGPRELVPVLAPAPAKVVSVAVTLGQAVKKGDVLMDIEVVATGQGLTPTVPSLSPTPRPSPAPPSSTVSPTAPAPAPAITPSPQGTTPTPSPGSSQAAPPPTASPAPSSAPTQTPPLPAGSPSPTTVPAPSPSSRPSPPQAQPQPSPEGTRPAPTPSPAPSPTPSPPPPSPSPVPPASYVVQPGDTLSGIAARYGTTVEDLVRANGIGNPDLIYPGQQLNIPQRRPGQGGAIAAPLPDKSRIVSSITSPIDGQIVKLEVRTDQLVARDAPLVVLADTSSLYLEVVVAKEDLPDISKGKSAQTVLDALPKETMRGKVEEVALEPVTGPLGTSGYPVKVGLEAPPKGIRLGMTGQTEIIGRQLTNILFIPKRAVLEGEGEAQVFVAEGDKVQRTYVTLGEKTRDYYEVSAGLVEGQQVVVSKLEELDDGRRIAIDRVVGPK